MTNDKTMRYDVAFSFLKEDEELATQLNDLLQDRVSTFLYSRRQGELAGTDGEKMFNQVFGSESRIVVVLFREGWGGTPWTRIEETAIRNRAFDEGYDFTLFIPLDRPPVTPPWLPKTRIWIGLDRWGVEGAASVIEARIQEAGGAPRAETVEERAARLRREIVAAEQRQAFLRSGEGVAAAAEELKALFAQIAHLADRISDPETRLTFRVEQDDRKLVVYSHGFSVSVAWSLQWGNSLEHSSLYVKLWEGAVPIRGRIPGEYPKELEKYDFDFDVISAGEQGWREAGKKKEFVVTSALADRCMTLLLKRVRSRRMG